MEVRKRLCGLFALVALLVTAGSVSADSILEKESLFSVTGSGPYTYNYTIELTDNSALRAGDYFEIVDFTGFVAGTDNVVGVGTLSTDWSFSYVPGTGTITNGGSSSSVPDSGATGNLQWTYNGSGLTNESGLSVILGVFSADSIYNAGPLGDGWMLAKDATTSGGLRTNTDNPTVPVPLPAAAWGGLGLLSVLGAARIRKAYKA